MSHSNHPPCYHLAVCHCPCLHLASALFMPKTCGWSVTLWKAQLTMTTLSDVSKSTPVKCKEHQLITTSHQPYAHIWTYVVSCLSPWLKKWSTNLYMFCIMLLVLQFCADEGKLKRTLRAWKPMKVSFSTVYGKLHLQHWLKVQFPQSRNDLMSNWRPGWKSLSKNTNFH